MEATSNIVWWDKKTAVRVNMTVWKRKAEIERRLLNGSVVDRIHPNIKAGATDATAAFRLEENFGIAYVGVQPSGPFDVDGETAREWLTKPENVNKTIPKCSGHSGTTMTLSEGIVIAGLSTLAI
jgi:hypothetical protein